MMSLATGRASDPAHRVTSFLLALLAGCLLACSSTGSRVQPTAPVLEAEELSRLPLGVRMPLTPEVRSGRLPNGVRYYIRENAEPTGRAELRFVVDAGSLVEEEEERGLAHFMEHMLFNGTKRFPGNDVVLFLQSTGMMVGADVNAYTGYDETVCVIKLPTDDPDILPTAFDVMQDWATAVSLDPREVDAERGVIVEERRMRRLSAQGRVSERMRELYLRDSRYAERSPIGEVEVIRNAPRDRLARFYRTWYRPENVSIVAVGDFDPDEVERLILERFLPIEAPGEAAPRPRRDVPPHEETLYAVVTDPEQPFTQVSVSWKRPAPDITTVGSYKDYLVFQLFDRLMSLRLLEASQEEGSPLLQPSAGRSLFVRSLSVWSVSALTQEGSAPSAVEALLSEVERVRRFGFTEAELARAKRDVATSYARARAEQQNTPSASLADELVRHVTTDEPVPGIVAEQALAERFLPRITLEDLEREARALGSQSRVVTALAPEKPGALGYSEAQLAEAVARVDAAELTPYEEELAARELMPGVPEPAAIEERREIPSIGATELVLENGARVLYKRTELREQEILFSASSPGGASLVSDADYPEARLAAAVAFESGAGSFSRLDLLKVLAGREARLVPTIDDYFEGFRGDARSADLPALLQLLHLFFTAPREDAAALERVRGEFVSLLENQRAVPETALEEAVNDSLYGDTVRAGLLPLSEVRELEAEKVFDLFRERFADASDFVFTFVGSFDPAELEDLVARYIGTLPATRSGEAYQDRLRPAPQQVVKRTVSRGREARSQVRLVFEGPLSEIEPESYMLATLLEQALGERLQTELRERRGAVYGVLTDVSLFEIPELSYRATIDFTTDPKRVDELLGVVFSEIEGLREKGPSVLTVALVRESERRTREEQMASNGFWLGVLERTAKLPGFDPARVLTFDEDFSRLTPSDVRSFAREILRDDQYVQVVLQPEGVSEPASGD